MKLSLPKKNFLYNVAYQVLVLIVPLITAPYLARVIGAEGVGTFSYTHSIVNYFMLLTLLGVNNYGSRAIAKVRDDPEKLSKTFWSIYMLQLVVGGLMLISYFVYLALLDNKYFEIAIIQGLYIISAIFDITWFYAGLEEFKVTVTRSFVVKLSTLLLIVVLVKERTDLWKYTAIMAGMTVLSQLSLWLILNKRVRLVKIRAKDVIGHIKPDLILFIPVIAVSLYKVMDKIMLGNMTNVAEVGFYDNADKIINIPLAVIIALGTVMLPRMSNIAARGDRGAMQSYIEKSIRFVMFLAFPMCLGLMAVGNVFAPIYFGAEFVETGYLIVLLATTIPFISFASVIRTQYLIPMEEDKIYVISVSLGALVNLILNYILIPIAGGRGACYATIAAELSVMLYQLIAVRKELPIVSYFLKVIPFLVKATLMFLAIILIGKIGLPIYLTIIMQVTSGIILYGLLNFKYLKNLLCRR